MTRLRWGLVAVMVLAISWASSAWYEQTDGPAAVPPATATATGTSVEEALLRPCRLPFEEETTLEAVAAFLRQTLHAPVVLDRAALDRQGITADSTVQLALDGVRLKTALRLLLDQVGLTYRVEAQDNLLVITDAQGADDPTERIFAELEALHRDVHDLQDAIDGLYEGAEEARGGHIMRAPRIIEELPGEPEQPAGPIQEPVHSRPG
jgi:hypothetical protein